MAPLHQQHLQNVSLVHAVFVSRIDPHGKFDPISSTPRLQEVVDKRLETKSRIQKVKKPRQLESR